MKGVFLFFMLLFLPLSVGAQIIITEIMYDLDGTDSKREWVEIYNTGSEDINIANWWFYNGGNHGFQNENAVLVGDAYAIIVDDPTKFSIDNPEVSVLILDSSTFSLKNTGEYIAIRNEDKIDVDGLTYVPIESANGKGDSLQKINGAWVAGTPTPGSANVSQSNGGGDNGDTENVANIRTPDVQKIEPIKSIKAFIKERKVYAVVGATTRFEGYALGLEDKPLKDARFMWNFGDGSTKEGVNVLHTFAYPGTYVVVLNISSGKYSASERIQINTIPIDVTITEIGPVLDFYITLKNPSSYELDLSGWLLKSGARYFTIPPNTFLVPRTQLTFSPDITALPYSHSPSLVYSNGNTAYVYTKESSPAILRPPQNTAIPKVLELQTTVVSPSVSVIKTRSVKEKLKDENDVTIAQTQTALLLNAPKRASEKGNFFSVWFLGLMAIIGIGLLGFVALKRNPAKALEAEEILTEEFDIEEINKNV